MPFSHSTPFKRIAALVIFVGIALLSGYIGGLFAQQVPVFEDIGTRPFILEQTSSKKSDNSLDEQYKKINRTTVAIVGEEKQGLISDSDIISYGVILTSDGWLVTSIKGFDPKRELYAVQSDGSVVRINQKVADSALPVQFLHMEVNGLSTADFLDDEELHEALSAYVFLPHNRIERLLTVRRWYPQSKGAQSIIRSSDLLQKVYPNTQSIQGNGAPVVTENGHLVGIIGDAGIIPSLYIQNGLKRLLKNGTIKRITLNIPYIDLSYVSEISSVSMRGARISTDKPISMLTKNGKISLLDGDTITQVNGEEIDENRSFSELLQDYMPNDQILLTIHSKQGDEKIIELILK